MTISRKLRCTPAIEPFPHPAVADATAPPTPPSQKCAFSPQRLHAPNPNPNPSPNSNPNPSPNPTSAPTPDPKPRPYPTLNLTLTLTLPQLTAELLQVAGRRACQSALMTLRPQIHYVLHADPLAAEPHDYVDPFHVDQKARHCFNADDLLKIDYGRAASAADIWAAGLSAGKVAPSCARRAAPSHALTLALSPPSTTAPPMVSALITLINLYRPYTRPAGSFSRQRRSGPICVPGSGTSAARVPDRHPLGCARYEGLSSVTGPAQCLPWPAGRWEGECSPGGVFCCRSSQGR